jgi:hypothetical protein
VQLVESMGEDHRVSNVSVGIGLSQSGDNPFSLSRLI